MCEGQDTQSHQKKLIMREGNTGLVARIRLDTYQEIAHESNDVSFSLHRLYFLCFKVVNQLNAVTFLSQDILR